MNEPPGARLRVGLSGLTVAEYFRDVENADVLVFIDNIFRFTQAGSEVSALLGRMPSAVGYQPTLATEMGDLQERITSTQERIDHVGAGDLRSGRRHHRSGAGDGVRAPRRDGRALARDHGARHLSRRRSARVVVANSRSRSSSASATTRSRPTCSGSCSATRSCRTSSRSSAWTSCREDDKHIVGRARRMQRFMSQPFAVAEQFTGIPGKYVKLEETISSFERLVAGEFDNLPEQAFFMAGGDRRRRRERQEAAGLSDAERLGDLAGGGAVRGRRRIPSSRRRSTARSASSPATRR